MASRDPAPGDSGLKHNPFAALRAKTGSLPSAPAPASPAKREPEKPAPDKKERAKSAPAKKEPANKQPAGDPARRIVLRRERKGRGGKAVTLAEGPGLAGRDLETLAREAARALGVGARAESGALVVQGEQVERLAAFLADRGFGPITKGN